MNVLYDGSRGLEIYRVQKKQDDFYYLYNDQGALWIGLEERVILECDDEVTIEKLKENYPEYFL